MLRRSQGAAGGGGEERSDEQDVVSVRVKVLVSLPPPNMRLTLLLTTIGEP